MIKLSQDRSQTTETNPEYADRKENHEDDLAQTHVATWTLSTGKEGDRQTHHEATGHAASQRFAPAWSLSVRPG